MNCTLPFAFAALVFPLLPADESVADIYEKALPAVVVIEGFDHSGERLVQGSGFFVDSHHVLTNHHVVDGTSFLVVEWGDSRSAMCTSVTAWSEASDYSKIYVEMPSSAWLGLSDSLPRVGEEVLAIGAPQGLEATLSTGVISGIRRLSSGQELVQTTAPISPGSSGGPLLNRSGQVVGIVSSYLGGAQNLNFAVPSSLVRSLSKSPRYSLSTLDSVDPLAPLPIRTEVLGMIEGFMRVEDFVAAIRLAETLCPPLAPDSSSQGASNGSGKDMVALMAGRGSESFEMGSIYLLLSDLWSEAESQQQREGTLESGLTVPLLELIDLKPNPARERSKAYKRAAYRVLSSIDSLETAPEFVAALVYSDSNQRRAEERLEAALRMEPVNLALRYVRASLQFGEALLGEPKDRREYAESLEDLVAEGYADQRMLQRLELIYDIYQGDPRSASDEFVPAYSRVELADLALEGGASIWGYRGLALGSTDLGSALVFAQRALELNPQSVSSRWLLVEIYLKFGDAGRAYDSALSAYRDFPQSPGLIEQLAKCCMKTGRPEFVRVLVDQAMQDGRARLVEVLLGQLGR